MRKSIWEQYNEMATRVDGSRELEWAGLADMILVLVSRALCFIAPCLYRLVCSQGCSLVFSLLS